MGKEQPTKNEPTPPKLVHRRANRNSSFYSGRTIGEKRERLETANERAAARKKDKRKKATRIIFTAIGFVVLVAILVAISRSFIKEEPAPIVQEPEIVYNPTLEVIDEDAASGSRITNRMKLYVGQAEKDFRDLGYKPTKAVIPSGAIREVDIYLDGYNGFIKLVIDRGTAVSAEDADRVIRYLNGLDIHDFNYIDVRTEGRAFWK